MSNIVKFPAAPVQPPATAEVVKFKPFVGVDGEGGGRDRKGRQHYWLLRMGERELFTGRPLRTLQSLEFICQAPANAIYVAFGFTYDATMILRDMPPERVKRLFQNDDASRFVDAEAEPWEYVAIGNYEVALRPGQYMRVRRLYPEQGATIPFRNIPGSARTIYETQRNFQRSFVTALSMFDIGTKSERRRMKAMKSRRSKFGKPTKQIRTYNQREVELLAQLMEKFRQVCLDAPDGGIKPLTWNGPGRLAAALLQKHDTPRLITQTNSNKYPLINLPNKLLGFAEAAYYGGRFEVTAIGAVPGPIYEYDIHSAYPAAMTRLPCLLHGKWKHRGYGEQPDRGSLYLATIRFKHRDTVQRPAHLCALPVRSKDGRLSWPTHGAGTYWSVEIDAGKKLHCDVVTWIESWQYQKCCDCHPFHWIEPLYEYRRRLGSSVAGYPLKLAINSLYGKLAQRQGGGGPYTNHLWAGLVTAYCRAQIIDAAAQHPDAIVMIATDGIYSRKPLSLEIGDKLGDWEATTHEEGIFIVQPGLWWAPDGNKRKLKTRGVPESYFKPRIKRFEQVWHRFIADLVARRRAIVPKVPVKITTFIGLRLASAWGNKKGRLAGTWLQGKNADVRSISFDWQGKRRADFKRDGEALLTKPRSGLIYVQDQRRAAKDPLAIKFGGAFYEVEWSQVYSRDVAPSNTMLEDFELLREALPDWFD